MADVEADKLDPWISSVRKMALRYGVDWKTADGWTAREGFPDRGKKGWSAKDVGEWVEAWTRQLDEKSEAAGDRAEKTRLECERLRVVIQTERQKLKLAEYDVSQKRGELVAMAEVLDQWSENNRHVMAGIEAARRAMTAKYRTVEDKGKIDEICDRVAGCIREEFE